MAPASDRCRFRPVRGAGAYAASGARYSRSWSTAVAVLAVVVGGWGCRDGYRPAPVGGNVLRGGYGVVLSPRVLLPAALGLAVVLYGPVLASRMRWWVLLGGSAGAAAAWAVALALSSGWHRLVEPLASRYEYPYDVPRVGGLGELLDTFTASVPAGSADPWTTHVAGHPPGALLAFVALDRLGLSGLGWAAALCIAGGAAAVPAVLVGVRAVGGEAAARTVAPFAVLAPTALWVATSADALFAGVAAWGWPCWRSLRHVRPWRRALPAVAGGLLLGSALFLSFGLAALGLTALAVVLVHRRRLGRGGVAAVLGIAAVGALTVVTAYAVAGYWWIDGLWPRQTGSDRGRPTPTGRWRSSSSPTWRRGPWRPAPPWWPGWLLCAAPGWRRCRWRP